MINIKIGHFKSSNLILKNANNFSLVNLNYIYVSAKKYDVYSRLLYLYSNIHLSIFNMRLKSGVPYYLSYQSKIEFRHKRTQIDHFL